MGCDIHCWCEVRKGRKWETVEDNIFPHPYYRADEPEDPEWNSKQTNQPIYGRNYDLFSILAGVRNYAGTLPIALPRGVPHNASPGYKEEVKSWSGNGHTHSWLTLKEILDFDWEGKKTHHEGYMSASAYKHLKETGKATIYCGGVYGPKIISNQEMDQWLTTHEVGEPEFLGFDEKQPYTLAHWQETYAQCALNFLTVIVPILKTLGKPEDVRLVFFFDN